MAVSGSARSSKYRQRLKEKAIELLGKSCAFCGTGEKLHAAHVIDTKLKGPSRGMDRRYRDVIKNPDSYRAMCVRCHRVFDSLTSLRKPVVEEPIPF